MNISAYSANLPCLNPNCHSYGRPHPNCRCYGFAGGGDVGHFCSGPRLHNKDCEYYMSEGGGVDLSGFTPDPHQPNESNLSGFVPDQGQMPAQQNDSLSGFTPDPHQPEGKYESLGQKLLTGAEGIAQGLAGPFATAGELGLSKLGVPGLTAEDIRGRAEANPLIHGGAEAATLGVGLLTGVGEAGLIARGAGAIAEAAELGKVGSLAIKGLVEGASFAGSDEITKAMLSQPGSDPQVPASAALLHVGAAGLMGGLTGGVFGLGEGMIGKASREITNKLDNWLIRVGESKDPLKYLGVTDKISGGIGKSIAWPLAVKTGTGQFGYEAIQQAISKPLSKIIGRANPYVTDAAIWSILTHETAGVSNAVHYASRVAAGAKKAANGVGSLFTAGSSQIAPPASDEAKKSLKDFIEGGQVEKQMQNTMFAIPPGFARGGDVSAPNDSFAKIFPEQNTILNAAKGRISNYLNSIRPLPNQPKLAFDKEPLQADKKSSYEKAIDLAVNPLSILDKINGGDITPEHMQHFKSLYPDVHKYLSQEMTKKITEAQLKGDVPLYRKRQGMSLFLGADLDSTFTPQSIATIQALYAAKKAGQQQQVAQKGKGSALSKSASSYLTDDQSREQRQQRSKA